jgi:hypothetical protein
MEDFVTFVTFKLAKILKEKGFPQFICDEGYIIKKDDYGHFDIGNRESVWLIPNYLSYIAAPTIAQVLKWLRKEKQIDAGAIWSNNDKVWVGYVNDMNMPDLVSDYVLPNNSYDSYEEAALAGIEYVLDNLI